MRSQLLVGDGVDLCGTWSQSRSIWSLTFNDVVHPQYLKCALFLLTSFHSRHAFTLLALCGVGIQAEFEAYGLMGMCNLALNEQT